MQYEYSEDWTLSEERPGYHFKTLIYNNCTINVYSPILTPEEAAKREKEVVNTISNVLSSHYKKKANNCLHILETLGIKTTDNIKYTCNYQRGVFHVWQPCDFFEYDSTILLDNNKGKRIIVLTIPANTFSVKKDGTGDFLPAEDDPDRLDLYIDAATLIDQETSTDFSPFVTARVSYK